MANRPSRHTPSGHRQTVAPPAQVFFMAAIRIPSQPHPLLCGYSATYKRRLSASIRPRSASIRQLYASIRRRSETDPARYAARPTPSASAPAEKRQIEHFKIPQKGTFSLEISPFSHDRRRLAKPRRGGSIWQGYRKMGGARGGMTGRLNLDTAGRGSLRGKDQAG